MFNVGAFAGGLAQGIHSGQNMALRQKQAERTAQADEREAEIHQARMDKAAFYKDKRDRLRAANDEIVESWRQSIRQQSMPSVTSRPDESASRSDTPVEAEQVSRESTGLFSPGGLSSKTTAMPGGSRLAGNKLSAGLMSQYRNRAAQKNPDKTPATETADEMIGRRMLTGDLLESPDELIRMANIYKKHGLLKEMTPWMNRAYEAKKKRIPEALSYLLTGDAKSARAILKKGGINLADDPVQINAEDRQKHSWRFKLEDGSEQEVNLRALMGRFFPEKSLEENRE
jgi:hypothetical protein